MTDIVERLRRERETDHLAVEAADEIERLRAAHREIMVECGGYTLSNDVANRVWDIARRALEDKP